MTKYVNSIFYLYCPVFVSYYEFGVNRTLNLIFDTIANYIRNAGQ